MRKITASLFALLIALCSVGAIFAEDSSYVVRPGDTLSAIAARFNTSIRALVQANGLEDPNLIYAGQTLALTGSARPSQPQQSTQASAPAAAPARQVSQSGTAVLSRQRWVTFYGNPWAAQMGILGEWSPDELVRDLRRVAALYQQVSDKPVQPVIHLIVTVAQASAGSDGMYRLRMPASMIEQYIDLAERNNMPIILDVQVGRSTVALEVAAIRQYLTKPNVHLALDPEFDMWGSELPGVQLGHMSAEEINHAVQVLADVVAANGLSNKVLVVHQFTESMVTNKGAIRNHPSVDIVIDMDGFGGQAAKISHYNAFVRDEPVEYAGIKLFYRHDVDLMTPRQVVDLTPPPDVVIYQ